jgi:hypothetical protein
MFIIFISDINKLLRFEQKFIIVFKNHVKIKE